MSKSCLCHSQACRVGLLQHAVHPLAQVTQTSKQLAGLAHPAVCHPVAASHLNQHSQAGMQQVSLTGSSNMAATSTGGADDESTVQLHDLTLQPALQSQEIHPGLQHLCQHSHQSNLQLDYTQQQLQQLDLQTPVSVHAQSHQIDSQQPPLPCTALVAQHAHQHQQEQHASQQKHAAHKPRGQRSSKPVKQKTQQPNQQGVQFPFDPDAPEWLLPGVRDVLSDKARGLATGLTGQHFELIGISSIDEYLQRLAERLAARNEVTRICRDPSVPGTHKMLLRCQYIHKYRKTLFTCPNCWLMPGLCVCGKMQRFKCKTQVLVSAHHDEWGRSSNTGTVIANTLDGANILLKGLPEHDDELQRVYDDSSVTTAILWPGDESLLPSELKQLADEKTNGRIAVVALDATWDGARRMKQACPPHVLQVKLPPSSTQTDQRPSLLRPLRKYHGDKDNGRVSTLEAVAALLLELEGDQEMYDGLLRNLKVKVDAARIMRNRPPVYGMDPEVVSD